MRKQVSYKDYFLVIKVELSQIIDAPKASRTYHKAHAKGYNNGYEKNYSINTSLSLKNELLKIEKDFIAWVDEPYIIEEEIIMAELGYVK